MPNYLSTFFSSKSIYLRARSNKLINLTFKGISYLVAEWRPIPRQQKQQEDMGGPTPRSVRSQRTLAQARTALARSHE
jgi:hypothetical protein